MVELWQLDLLLLPLLKEKHVVNQCTRFILLETFVSSFEKYLVVMMGAFAVLAWIGSLIDNLLLTYLLGTHLFSY